MGCNAVETVRRDSRWKGWTEAAASLVGEGLGSLEGSGSRGSLFGDMRRDIEAEGFSKDLRLVGQKKKRGKEGRKKKRLG